MTGAPDGGDTSEAGTPDTTTGDNGSAVLSYSGGEEGRSDPSDGYGIFGALREEDDRVGPEHEGGDDGWLEHRSDRGDVHAVSEDDGDAENLEHGGGVGDRSGHDRDYGSDSKHVAVPAGGPPGLAVGPARACLR